VSQYILWAFLIELITVPMTCLPYWVYDGWYPFYYGDDWNTWYYTYGEYNYLLYDFCTFFNIGVGALNFLTTVIILPLARPRIITN